MTTVPSIPGPLAERQDALETALREHMERSSVSGLPLYRMMQYQLGWVESDGSEIPAAPAERFYGAVCLEAAASVSDDWTTQERTVLPAAVGMELLHQSLRVHEDMQSAEQQTEGHLAVWWVWGPAQAINVGDGLYALARLAVFRMREHDVSPERTLASLGALDALALRYYEGQYLELTYQERVDITERQYLAMAESKGGALLGGAAALGASAGGADDSAIEAFQAFGQQLGCALQIHADVTTLWADDANRAGRVLNKSKLYPVVYALEHGTLAQKRALGGIYFKRVMEPPDVEALRALLDEVGAREQAEASAHERADAALGLLDATGISGPVRERWEVIARALLGSV